MIRTYNHQKVNVSFNGVALTDFNGDISIEKQGDDFDVIEGSNGAVERARMVRKLYTVTIPFMQTSPQVSAIEALRIMDEKTNVGPFPFALTDLNGVYVIAGQGWVKSMGSVTRGRSTSPRVITFCVYANVACEGA